MLTKPQYFLEDWLELHGLTSEDVVTYCGMIRSKYLPDTINAPSSGISQGMALDFGQSLESLVIPSLKELLSSNECDLSSVKIVRHKVGNLNQPYTEWCENENAPVIHLVWDGNADDIICLSHEIAHAAQMILSKNMFMPPVAREVCAFLGELALIRCAKMQSDALFKNLCAVWLQENQRYLGSDVAQLADPLNVESYPYTYRHNYPLARIAAMSLFGTHSPDSLANCFSSGSTAMAHLDLPAVIEKLQSCVTVTRVTTSSAPDEDITAFKMSLSPDALKEVSTGQIEYAWLYRPARAGCVIDTRVESIKKITPQEWFKWRSLGVFVLAALRRGEADLLPADFLKNFEEAATQKPVLICSMLAPWVQPLTFDALTALGMAIQQLAISPYHQQFKLSYYIPVEILPSLRSKQVQCYLNADGNPLGLVTWAWLTEKVKQDIHVSGRALEIVEWSEGSHLFFNDWITVPTAFRTAMAHMTQTIFPNEIASSLRRNSDGSVRRVNKWVGRMSQAKKMSIMQ
jgi:hemolysin-activating ACP:hemolysin acyltransferase